MDTLEMARALFGNNAQTAQNGGQTTTTYGIAVSDSVDGIVQVNLGGDTASEDDDQTIEVETTFFVKEGDEVIVQLVGADGTGKAPCVIGVVGRGDETQTEIESVTNYVWSDAAGLHVSTQERSVQGANVLLDSDSLDIRNGNSNSEADQTVYASFGREVTVGSRLSAGTVGQYSQVFGSNCTASGSYSHAEGLNTHATANYTHAEGYASTASGAYSHAEGYDSTSSAVYAHAEGYKTTASGQNAHSEGFTTLANGYASHAEGNETKAYKDYSHAEGLQCEAGLSTGASSYKVASHAEGRATAARGAQSHSEGYLTTAASDNQHVQGKLNVTDSSSKYADIVGNGDLINGIASNAYNLDWNGNAEFQGEVYLGGCTPNGETPYPAVRYNTSSSQSEYYDTGTSAWTAVPGGGGGGGGWTSLWTNPNPDSAFAAQTVSIDLSSWHLICILAKPQNTGATTSAFLAAVGTENILTVPNLGSTQYFYKRNATISTSGVTFSTGYRNTNGTSGTGYCIPTAIYGLA